WFAVACESGSSSDVGSSPSVPTDSGSTHSAETGTSSPLPTTTPGCAVGDGLTVDSVSVSQPWHESEAQISVTLSARATAGLACTLDSDPTEVHLIEDPVKGTTHQLRLAGLLGGSSYSCVAAGECPGTAAPYAFPLATRPSPANIVPIVVDDLGPHGNEYVLV